MTTHIDGVSTVLHQYDAYLIDQFGVLHDGSKPYPHAVSCLEALKAANKTVIIVSNSGKRSSSNIARMTALGIPEALYDHFVTSGDVAYHYLKKHLKNTARQRCFLIARDGDTSAVDQLDLELCDHPDKADLIIIAGSQSDHYDERYYAQLLATAAARNTLCLCTNPDKMMLTPNGLRFGAGRIADIYTEQGGEVVWIGKPYAAIYTHALELALVPEGHKGRTLCIGDSLEHDIAGGNRSGLDTLLVRTGIISGVDDNDLLVQFERMGVTPDYIADEFTE